MYLYKTIIKLHDTDAAGILFFSHQFEIIHDAYETLLEKIGFGFAELIRHKDLFLPIVPTYRTSTVRRLLTIRVTDIVKFCT